MLYGKAIKDYEFVIFVGDGEEHTDYMNHIEDFLFVDTKDITELKDNASVWRKDPATGREYMLISLNPFR